MTGGLALHRPGGFPDPRAAWRRPVSHDKSLIRFAICTSEKSLAPFWAGRAARHRQGGCLGSREPRSTAAQGCVLSGCGDCSISGRCVAAFPRRRVLSMLPASCGLPPADRLSTYGGVGSIAPPGARSSMQRAGNVVEPGMSRRSNCLKREALCKHGATEARCPSHNSSYNRTHLLARIPPTENSVLLSR